MADEKKATKPVVKYPDKPESSMDFTFDYIKAHARDKKEVAEWCKEYFAENPDAKFVSLRSAYVEKFWKGAFPKKTPVKKPGAMKLFMEELKNM